MLRAASNLSAGMGRGIVALACFLAFLLRVLHAGDQGIWGDEIFSVWYASMSLPDIIRVNLANLDAHAPLFYYVLKFWTVLAGQNELVFRFPSAFFGVLAVPLIYLLGKLLAGRGVGVTASLIMALNPFQVWYGQETRTYALTTFLTLLSVLLFLRLLQQKGSLLLWAGYCLATLLSISSHYYAFFILAVEDFYLLLLLSRGKLSWRPWAAAQAVLLLPLLAGLWQASNMMLRYQPEALPLAPLAIVRDYLLHYSVGWFLDPVPGRLALAATLAFASLGLLWLLWARRWPGVFLFLYLALPFAGAIAYFWITAGFPPRERYLIIVTPAFYLLTSTGIALARRLSPWLVAVALLVVLSPQAYALGNYYREARFERPDYRAIARHVQSWEDKGDAVVAIGHLAADIFRYYYKGDAPVTQFRYHPGEDTGEEIRVKLEGLAREHKRIWLLPSGDGRDDPEAEEWLLDNAFEVDNRWIGQARRALYATSGGADETMARVGANLENRLELAGYSLSSKEVMSGDILRVRLAWRALQGLDQRYKVSLRLRDDRGHVLRQIDRPLGGSMPKGDRLPGGAEVTDKIGLQVPYGTMPGPASLEIGVYQESDGRNLSFLDGNLAPKGTWLTLATAQVVKGPTPASLDRIETARRASYDLDMGLRLIGFGLGPETLAPGETLTVLLSWQALRNAAGDAGAKVQLIDEKGAVAAEVSVAAQRYAGWAKGEIFRDFVDLNIPANAAGGRYQVRLAPGDGPAAGGLGVVTVKARQRRFEMPKAQQSLATAWEDVARLRGYDLSGEKGPVSDGLPATRPGGSLSLTLYWEALSGRTTSYSVFTHLLDAGGRTWGQHDGIPASGAAPTAGWVIGEFIADRHDIAVKEDAPPGEYVIEVGLYDPVTGTRLKTDRGEDRLIIARVVIGQR